MSDLTLTEQKHVRTALLYLRRRTGAWSAVAAALNFSPTTIERVANGRLPVSASLAMRVARLLDTSVDALLEGRPLQGVCPRCGYSSDFADESTVAEDGPRPESGGLKLVK